MHKSSFNLPPKQQPGDVYWVGTAYDPDYTYFALSDGQNLLVVRTDSCWPSSAHNDSNSDSDSDRFDDRALVDTDDPEVVNAHLAEMATLCGTRARAQLRFGGSTSSAALLRSGRGGYAVEYVPDPSFPVRCELWAPLVDEREICVTRWMDFHRRRGLWKGREVDVLMDGCDEEGARAVGEVTDAYWRMRGTGCTFEVLGHVTRHGRVVGLMTERIQGRPPRYEDRQKVYAAVAKLQRHGLLHTQLDHDTIVISPSGHVRFVSPEDAVYFPPEERDELDRRADEWEHWTKLPILFEEMRTGEAEEQMGAGAVSVYTYLMLNAQAEPVVISTGWEPEEARTRRLTERDLRRAAAERKCVREMFITGELGRWLDELDRRAKGAGGVPQEACYGSVVSSDGPKDKDGNTAAERPALPIRDSAPPSDGRPPSTLGSWAEDSISVRGTCATRPPSTLGSWVDDSVSARYASSASGDDARSSIGPSSVYVVPPSSSASAISVAPSFTSSGSGSSGAASSTSARSGWSSWVFVNARQSDGPPPARGPRVSRTPPSVTSSSGPARTKKRQRAHPYASTQMLPPPDPILAPIEGPAGGSFDLASQSFIWPELDSQESIRAFLEGTGDIQQLLLDNNIHL